MLGPLAGLSAATITAGYLVHSLLFVLAPLNLLFLYRGYRDHNQPTPLVVGAVGIALISSHLIGHFGTFDWLVGDTVLFTTDTDEMLPDGWFLAHLPIWAGSLVLAVGSYLDIRARWDARSEVIGCETAEDYWRLVLTGQHPGLREGRQILRLIPSPPRCKLCNAPFRGAGGILMRALGRRPAGLNPSFCTSCLTKTPAGGADIEATVFFADVRDSTGLAARIGSGEFVGLMDRFYIAATDAITRYGGLVKDFAGDGVVALFTPGFASTDHAREAALAAGDLLARLGYANNAPWLPVGVGIHTGTCFVGLLASESGVSNLSALGDAMNVAARLGSAARAGEILLSEAALERISDDDLSVERRLLTLKGIAGKVRAGEIRVERARAATSS